MEADGEENVILPEHVWNELFGDLGIDFPPPVQEVGEEANNVNEERNEENEETDSADEVVIEAVSTNNPDQFVGGYNVKSATEESTEIAEDNDKGEEDVFETGSKNSIATIVSRQKLRALRTMTKPITEEVEDNDNFDEVIEPASKNDCVASTSRQKTATDYEGRKKTRTSRHKKVIENEGIPKTGTDCDGRQKTRTSRHKKVMENEGIPKTGTDCDGRQKTKTVTKLKTGEAKNTGSKDKTTELASKHVCVASTSRHRTTTDIEGRHKTWTSRHQTETDSKGIQKTRTITKLKTEKAENTDSGNKAIGQASKNVFAAGTSRYKIVTDSKGRQKIWTLTKVKTEAEGTKRGDKTTEPTSKNVCAASTSRHKTATTVDIEVSINANECFKVDLSTNGAAVSVRVVSYEEAKRLLEIRDYFVDKLIEAVKQIKGELEISDEYVFEEEEEEEEKEKDEGPGECYFSRAHRYTIWKYIRSQKRNFDVQINNYARIKTSGYLFEICKIQFIETFKPEGYSEIGFINFCAAVAYLGIHWTDYNLDCNAEIKVKGYIGYLLWDVLTRGPLQDSSW